MTTYNNLDAGGNGRAGSLDIYPPTRGKGKVSVRAADNTGGADTVVTYAAGSVARAYTVPDGGAAASFVLSSAGLSAAEVDVLDSVTPGTAAASKALVLDSNKDVAGLRDVGVRSLKTTGNVGAAATGSTATEYGDGSSHRTVLAVSTTLPAIAGGANLGVGKLLYTFPAGAIIVHSAYMSLAITQTEGNITADTPDGGLGTVIASGAVAVLSGTAAFEDILTGQTFNDCNGTAEVKTAIPTANVPLVIEAAAAHTVYFNVADGWAASGDAAALLAGTVVINWSFVV